MPSPDHAEPIELQYAGMESGSRPKLRAPARPWLLARIALFISMTAIVIIVLAKDLPFIVSAGLGMLSSAAAFIFLIVALGRNTHQAVGAIGRLPLRSCMAALAAAVAFLGFNGWTCSQFNRCFHNGIYGSLALAQLRNVANMADEYRRDHGVYPGGPEDLVRSNLLTDRLLVLPMDTVGWQSLGMPPIVPSYILRPQARAPNAAPNTIHVYERQPWSVDGIRLFQQKRHAVVYADGTSAFLSSVDLAAQLSASSP